MEGTEIILVRHGQTVWNTQGRIQGAQDSPLTTKGIEAARALGRRLHGTAKPIVAIYSSPLGRAWHTAELLAAQLAAPIAPERCGALRERSFGCLEGLTSEEQQARYPKEVARNNSRDPDYAPPGGETRHAARARALAGLEEIAKRHPGQRVLCVSHSGLLATMMVAILNQAIISNPKIRSLAHPNTAINMVRWSGDGWQVVLWGDVGEFAAAAPLPATERGSVRISHQTLLLIVAVAAASGAAAVAGVASLASRRRA